MTQHSISLTTTRPGRLHPIAILIYSVGALLLSWPLVAHITTHVPGNGIDDPSLAWNLWWIKTRLVDQLNLDIFHVDWMFHPININLAFYTLTPLNGLLSIPLQTALSHIVATNALLLCSFILSGYGAFLLAQFLLREKTSAAYGAALLAGGVYAFASTKLFYASLGQFNIASSQWIPFTIFYILRISEAASMRTRLRSAALAALFFTFQAWAELTYASFLIIFVLLHFTWYIVTSRRGTGRRRRPRRSGDSSAQSNASERPESSPTNLCAPMSVHTPSIFKGFVYHIAPYLLLAVLFLIGITPFLWAMLPDMLVEGDFAASGGGFANTFSADLLGYLMPTRLHPVVGGLSDSFAFDNSVGQQIYLGYSVLILAAIGAGTLLRSSWHVRRQQGWFWLGNTFLFWSLTLGPSPRWNGQDLPLPGLFELLSRLPFFSLNRYPSRYGVMLTLCVALFAAVGIHRICRAARGQRAPATRARLGAETISIALAVLILAEHLSVPLPIQYSVTPTIYRQLRAAPGDFAVLELPTGWRNGARVLGKSDELIMMQQWFQAIHGKRRLGGNTSRHPPYKFQYFIEAPLIGDLITLMNADAQHPYLTTVVEADLGAMIQHGRVIAPHVLDFLGIDYVTVHVEQAPPMLIRFIDEALPLTQVDEWQGQAWTVTPHTIRLYRVDRSPQPPGGATWEIDLRTREGNLYLAEGWSSFGMSDGSTMPARYATRSRATLLLDLPTTSGRLELEFLPPIGEVELWLNGQRLSAEVTVQDASAAWITVDMPAGLADLLVDRLEIRFADSPVPVTSLSPAPDVRGWPLGHTERFLPSGHALVVRSAGVDSGDFAQIFVDGQEIISQLGLDTGEPGYYLAAVSPQGEFIDATSFNTLASPDAATALAAWMHRWPAGTIIAGAVADTAVREEPISDLYLGQDAIDALATSGVSIDLRGRHRWGHAFIGVVGAPSGTALEEAALFRPAAVAVGPPVTNATATGGIGRIRYATMQSFSFQLNLPE